MTGPNPSPAAAAAGGAARRAWLVRNGGLCGGFLLSVLILAFIGQTARNWNPALSSDTLALFYPKVALLNSNSLAQAMAAAVLVPKPEALAIGSHQLQPAFVPDSAAAKPVFVVILQLWHAIYRALGSKAVALPDGLAYSDFIFATLLLAFAAIVWLGKTLGNWWLGLLSGLIALANPWAITAIYFNSYTAISIVFLCLAYGLTWKNTRRSLFLAGLLMSADVLVNQSVTVFAAAFAAVPMLRASGWKGGARGACWYAAGAMAAWSALELFILAQNLSRGGRYAAEIQVLLAYLRRSMVERSGFLPASLGSFFPLLVWKSSPVYALALCYSAVLLLARGWKRGRSAFGSPEGILFLTVLAVLLLIDLRPGHKFSRTYFLLVPFTTMFIVATFQTLVLEAGTARRVMAGGALALAMGHLECAAGGLLDQKTAFLAARDILLKPSAAAEPTFVFLRDAHLPFFAQLLGERPLEGGGSDPLVVESLCPVDRAWKLSSLSVVVTNASRVFFPSAPRAIKVSSATVLVGPNVHSVLNLPGYTTDVAPLELRPEMTQASGQCSNLTWTAELHDHLPFFSHYPFLVLEDPEMTFAMRMVHAFGWDDYKDGIGRVSIWKVNYRPIPVTPPHQLGLAPKAAN